MNTGTELPESQGHAVLDQAPAGHSLSRMLLPMVMLALAACGTTQFYKGPRQSRESVAVIEPSQDSGEPEDLVEEADRALYVAKAKGRNVVACHDDVQIDSAFP